MKMEEVPHKGAKVYSYTRVSTLIQVDGYSLAAQREIIQREADHQGMHIVGEYSDEGKSGKDIKGRPGFQRMMNDIIAQKDGVSFVLVFKLSRFGRNAADILNSLRTMNLYGVHLICVEDKIDSSLTSGKLMISILGAMAEIERVNIMTQTMSGRQEKARQGLFNGGVTPYGYSCDKEGKLHVIEEEAETVRLIFEKYVTTTLGPTGVAELLNAMGYKKNVKRPREVEFFTRPFVLKIIKNPVYLGHIAYGKTTSEKRKDDPESYHRVETEDYILAENAHESIISQELWDAAQKKRISMQGKKEKSDPSHEYLLSGLVRCPQCGRVLYGIPGKHQKRADGTAYPQYYAYVCRPSLSERKRGNDCHFGQIACQKIEEPLRDILLALTNSENFGEKLTELADEKVSKSEVQKVIDATEAALRQATARQRKLEDTQYHLDVLDKHYDRKYDTLQRQLEETYDELDSLEERLADAQAQLASIIQQGLSRDSIYESLKVFDKIYDLATDRERKDLLQSFIERIEIYPEKDRKNGCQIREIRFRFPVSYKGESVYSIHFQKGEKPSGSNAGVYHSEQSTDETVVLLSHKKPDGHINVKVEFGEGEGKVPLDNIAKRAEEYKPKERVTYKMIKEYIEANGH